MISATRDIAIATTLAISTLAISALAVAQFSSNGDKIALTPLQAHTVSMSDYTAVVYYTILENGHYKVVTTVGPNAGVQGQSNQHQVTLAAGQLWSLDIADGDTTEQISFSAEGDQLLIASR